ncbi:MAG: DUF2510 domain-containing protein [Actinomycetia bacterium]|nr:DUF2510 domain-containing protein [Actinomycetes bacterium]
MGSPIPPGPTTPTRPDTSLVPPPPSTPAGWYRDPAQNHDLRYFDGTTWTSHVSTDGSESTDPI